MKSHHGVGHFKARLMIAMLSLVALTVTAAQSFAATTCLTCHGMPPVDTADGSRNTATGAFRGNHQIHMGATASDAECSKCHGNSGYNNDHSALSANKINMSANINTSIAGGTYSKAAPFDQSATPTLGTCSNVNCHFETVTPTWGKLIPATNCNSCHATPPVTASHAKHLASAAFGTTITCAVCHPDYGTTSFSHATSAGKHKIVVNISNQYSGGTSISWLPSQTKAYGSCTTYCHSNGNEPSGNIPRTWGATSTGCTFCHPNLSGKHSAHVIVANLATSTYGSTANNSVGNVYDFGCGSCHPVDIANHINTTVDVTLNKNHGGTLKSKNNTIDNISGYTQSLGTSVTCAAAYCHSNGMTSPTFYGDQVNWYEASYGGDKCARCHGNSPNTDGKVGSNAHTAHVVGIHYDDIFNGVSKKLTQSGPAAVNAAHGRNSRSTTINCNICHAATVTSSANDNNFYCSGCHAGSTPPGGFKNSGSLIAETSMHVNGTVDVAFINQKLVTKAQVADSAFKAYTASTFGWKRNSNGMKFKTYTSSYDYTKSTLASVASPYSAAAGCLNIACHAGVAVKWTDTVTCNSCHTRLK